MSEAEIVEIVGKIVTALTPLSHEERQRAVQASLNVFGESMLRSTQRKDELNEIPSAFSERARIWIKQNELSLENLEQIFHITDTGAELIIQEVPGGKDNKPRVLNVYVLSGVASLLTSENSNFDDKVARTICESFGCYDPTNHTKYLKKSKFFTGSKKTGWTLTAQGLKHAAMLVRELSKPQ